MPPDILDRADALMQRRRASSADLDDTPVLTEAFDADDDIPLLLDSDELPDAVAEPPVLRLPDPTPVASASALLDDDPGLEGPMLDIIAHELARRVSQRLEAELPRIVEATVRDFLAEPDIQALIQRRS